VIQDDDGRIDAIEEQSPGRQGRRRVGHHRRTPTVVNAIVDALARSGLGHGADQLQMPFTPERVWEALREIKAGRGARGGEGTVPESTNSTGAKD
jgi:carbon-monoxide dehydrogenase large subunit